MKFSTKLALACGALAVLAGTSAAAGPVFGSSSYNSSIVLNGTTTDTAAGAAYSNGSYYMGYGGGSGSPIVQANGAGILTASTSPSPGIDFRSVFTNGAGDVFARGFANNTIYQQGTFGDFTAQVVLDGDLDVQSQVVLTSDGSQYVGNHNGVLKFWDLAGAFTHSVTLGGGFDTGYPQGRAVSIFGDYALNYSAGTLSAYSLSNGALLDQTTLTGAANGFESLFGQSYANGYFFVSNDAGDLWSGYQIGTPGPGVGTVPEPGAWALMILGFGAAGSVLRRRRSALTA